MKEKTHIVGISLQAIWRGLLTIVIAFVISLSLTGGIFARYNTSYDSGATGHIASFNPSITYDEILSYETTLGDFGYSSHSVIPFHIDNSENEVGSELVITIETRNILPLELSLYNATEEELDSAEVLYPSIMTDNSMTFVVDVGFDSADFSLVVEWDKDGYSELFSGLSDVVKITVVSKQTR